MQLPSRDAVDHYLSALETALHTNENKLSLTQDTMIRLTAVYVCQWWAESLSDGTKAVRQRLRRLVGEKHIACATLLLDVLGTHQGKLAAVNGALLWCALVDADVQTDFTDTRAGCITCCICRQSGLAPFCMTPGLWLRQRLCVPICKQCSDNIERVVPLHKSSRRRHCSACGCPLDGVQAVERGNDDRLCTPCDSSVVTVD